MYLRPVLSNVTVRVADSKRERAAVCRLFDEVDAIIHCSFVHFSANSNKPSGGDITGSSGRYFFFLFPLEFNVWFSV